MRILHIQKAKGVGGSERHLAALLSRQAERGSHVRMAILDAPGGGDFAELLEGAGVDAVHVGSVGTLNIRVIQKVIGEIARFQPDVIHTHLIHADVHGLLAARLRSVRAVSSMHGTYGFYRRPPYRSAARVVGRLASRTIAISEHVKRFISSNRLAPADRVRVVHYGVEVASWAWTEEDRLSARAEWGIAPGEVAVGIASRLVPHKGHEVLIDAVSRVVQQTPVRLLIAGDGSLRSDLEHYANVQAAAVPIRFLGFVPDMKRFMAGCDIFVFPTQPAFGEGFGLAALEAMAAGRPVVASNVDSLPEIIEDGRTGLLFDPRAAVDDLARTLHRLALDEALRASLGRAGRARARSLFDLDKMVDGIDSVYAEVVEKHSR